MYKCVSAFSDILAYTYTLLKNICSAASNNILWHLNQITRIGSVLNFIFMKSELLQNICQPE